MTSQKKDSISVVIPFYNEEGNVGPLIQEIESSLEKDFPKNDYEIIMVDDGSSDSTAADMRETKKHHKNTRGILLNKNYGQATALYVGFQNAKWDYIFSLDGDGQNNPSDFQKLYQKLINEDLDVVAGWRQKRKDPAWMIVITKSARFLRWMLIQDWVKDSGCTLRIYKNSVVKDLELWGEMHRYIIALSKLNGYKIGELSVDHRAREVWVSKYNWKKSFKWLIDLIYIWFIAKYEWRPLHLFWFLGIINFSAGSIMILWALYKRIFLNIDISNNGFFTMGIFLTQMWLMLFIFWVIIDLLIRINRNTSPINKYLIKEEI